MYNEYTTSRGRACFLTLTYDNDHIVNYSLDKRHVQLYLKRFRFGLRKTDIKIKYYLAGEYGSKTSRPHYHLIMFGMYPSEYLAYDTLSIFSVKSDLVKINSKHWPNGYVAVGIDCNQETIRYTAKYINKLLYGKYNDVYNYGRVPPFQTASLGLGLDYLEQNRDTLLQDKYIQRDGLKLSLPGYYKKKLELTAEDYNEQIIKQKNDIELMLSEQYGITQLYETDIVTIDICNRNPQDADRIKLCGRWLSESATEALRGHRRAIHYSIKKKSSLREDKL